jgi:pimeloyl-ACP methyl ester carboxylesterase
LVDKNQGSADQIYIPDVHAVGTREVLEKAQHLGTYEVVDGGAHYLSWGKWELVNAKIVEVMEASGSQ